MCFLSFTRNQVDKKGAEFEKIYILSYGEVWGTYGGSFDGYINFVKPAFQNAHLLWHKHTKKVLWQKETCFQGESNLGNLSKKSGRDFWYWNA